MSTVNKRNSGPFTDVYLSNIAALRSIDIGTLRSRTYGCRLSIELSNSTDEDGSNKHATVYFSVLPESLPGEEPLSYTDRYELIQTRYNITTRVRTLVGSITSGRHKGRNYAFDIDPSRIDEPLTPAVYVSEDECFGHQFDIPCNTITVVPGLGPVRLSIDPRSRKSLSRCWRQMRLHSLWAEVLSLDGGNNA